MPLPFPFMGAATAIGSLPHTDAGNAAAVVLKAQPQLPGWPQLYHRSPLEQMGPQFASGLTGAEARAERVWLPSYPAAQSQVALEPERAAGFFAFLEAAPPLLAGAKGQTTGPVTFAYLADGPKHRPAVEDFRLARRIAHHLGQLAAWQEWQLRRVASRTLIFLDEPALPRALNDPLLGPPAVADLLTSTLIWLKGMKGLHCCAPPPWRFLFSLPLDVISFDAYHYAETLREHAAELAVWLEQGRAIAWGIVPSVHSELATATPQLLVARLRAAWEQLAVAGVPVTPLQQQALITPACGLAGVSEAEAERALELTGAVAELLTFGVMNRRL